MPTRNVVLTDHQSRMIDELVRKGRYQNASEVLRDGLRLVEEKNELHASRVEALRAAAQVGVDAIERGDFMEFDNSKDLERYLNEIGDRAIARALGEQ